MPDASSASVLIAVSSAGRRGWPGGGQPSSELARAIENEATYPGQVRVVVVRETRASDYAR